MYKEVLKIQDNFLSIEPNNIKKIENIRIYLDGVIPPSYERYLTEIGHGGIPIFDILGTGARPNIPSLIYNDKLVHSRDKYLDKSMILIMDIGDDISWYLDISKRQSDGECRVVGWISGLSKDQQPDWLKEQETFSSFEEFFKSKIGLKD